MSFREEDKEKEKSGLGTGLAVAAAIGVGVGAALYYFINKRPENPTATGSTTQGWTCESPHALHAHEEPMYISDDSFTTLSEHTTTDTSIFEDSFTCRCEDNKESEYETFESEESSFSDSRDNDSQLSTDTSMSTSDDGNDMDRDELDNNILNTIMSNDDLNDSELSDWDVETSLDYPSYEHSLSRSYIQYFTRNLIKSHLRVQRDNLNARGDEAFRERTWSLEECSICFDVILRDQEIMALPCTHNFHTKCILPWLQEQQTCPNCRKPID